MRYQEFEKSTAPTIVIVHNDYQQVEKSGEVKKLGRNYHVVIPVLEDNQNPDAAAQDIAQKCSGKVYAIWVWNDGWSILKSMLEKRRLYAKKLLLESPECRPGSLLAESAL